MRLVKLFSFNLVCAKNFLCEYFLDKNLIDEKKGITVLIQPVAMSKLIDRPQTEWRTSSADEQKIKSKENNAI